jgi:DNA-binding NtrC family response regulator
MHNVLERAAQIARHSVLSVKDLELQHPVNVPSKGNSKQAAGTDSHLTLRELESRYIETVLLEESGSIDRAARRLGISRSSLYSKVKSREVERRFAQC